MGGVLAAFSRRDFLTPSLRPERRRCRTAQLPRESERARTPECAARQRGPEAWDRRYAHLLRQRRETRGRRNDRDRSQGDRPLSQGTIRTFCDRQIWPRASWFCIGESTTDSDTQKKTSNCCATGQPDSLSAAMRQHARGTVMGAVLCGSLDRRNKGLGIRSE